MLSEEVSRKEREEIDIKLFGVVALLVFFGMAALYSSTFYTKNVSFAMQASVTLTLGTISLFLGMAIRTDYWKKIATPLIILTGLLLILVLINGVGVRINGAKRWLRIWKFNFQVSELAKVSLILYLANSLHITGPDIREFKEFAKHVIIVGVIGLLIAVEPSISAASIIVTVGFFMIFYAGARLRHVLIAILSATLLLGALILFYPHARNRILNKKHKSGDLYQVEQSKLAIANGGITGRGPGRGLAKYRYLPEISNDFIFALIAEEYGFVGSFIIVLLFIFLTIRGFYIARKHMVNTYKTTLAMGITLLFSLQAALHIGINTGIIPPTGVILPFVSYGKMAILTNMFLAGILIRLYYEIEESFEI